MEIVAEAIMLSTLTQLLNSVAVGDINLFWDGLACASCHNISCNVPLCWCFTFCKIKVYIKQY